MSEAERIRWARALWMTGWVFVVSYLFIVTFQVRRAAAIAEGSFEDGLWWQRVEQASAATIPQNLIVLVPAAAAAIVGRTLVRAVVDPAVLWLAQLTRLVAGIAILAGALALLGIVGIFFRNFDGIADLGAFLLRLGGTLIALTVVRLCYEAERSN